MIGNFSITLDNDCPLHEIPCPENLKEKWVGAMVDSSGHGENYSAAIRLDFSSNCDTKKVLYSIIKVLSINTILAGQFKIVDKKLMAFVPTPEELYKTLVNKINSQNNIELNDEIFKNSTKYLKSPENIGLRIAYSKKQESTSVWIGFWTFTCDGISIDILIKKMIDIYNGKDINEENNWINYINTIGSSQVKHTLIDSEIYSQKGPYGVDNVRNTPVNSKGKCKNIDLHTSILTKDINSIAKNLRITPFALMFGAFQNTIMHLSDLSRIVTGVPYINRLNTEESTCIGPFSNTIPILTERKSTNKLSRNFLKSIQKDLIIASKKQNINTNKYYPKGISPRNVDYVLPFPQIFNAWNSQLSGKSIMLNNSESVKLHLVPNNTTRSGFELTLNSNMPCITGHMDIDVDAYEPLVPDFKEKFTKDLKSLIDF